MTATPPAAHQRIRRAATRPSRRSLTELLDGRTAVGSPRSSPDGGRIAFVVATIDLEENTTTDPRVAGRPDGDPAPAHRRSRRRPAGVVAGRALARVHVASRREGQGDDAARHADRRPGRGAHGGDDARRPSPTCAGHPTASGWRSPAAPATPATTPRTRAGSRRARSRRSSPGSTAWAGSSTGPSTCTSCPPTAPARRATSRPAASSTTACRGWPTRPAWSRRRRATTAGTATSPRTSTSCPLDGDDPGAHQADRHLRRTRRCPPTAPRVAFLGVDDPTTDPQNAKVGVDRR